MKLFCLCVLFVSYFETHESKSIHDSALNFFEREINPYAAQCVKGGYVCDCDALDQIYYCNDVNATPEQMNTCENSYCYSVDGGTNGECRKEIDPSCRNDANFQFKCSSGGSFPDPYSCTKYHLCVETSDAVTDNPVECPAGFYYDPVSTSCDATECTTKPLSCPSAGKNFSYEWHDRMYFICFLNEIGPAIGNDLIPIIFLCPNGIFDESNDVCAEDVITSTLDDTTITPDDTTTTPEETTTTPEETTTTPEDTTTTPEEVTTTPEEVTSTPEDTTTTPEATTTTPEDTTTTAEVTTTTETPKFDCDEKTLYPNETNCLHYVDCRSGEPIDRKCPTGHSFDPEKRKCVPGTECVKSTTSSTTTTTTAESTATTPWTPETTTAFPSTPTACAENTLYPNETNCLYYVDCRTGTPIDRKCPTGQSFDPATKRCVPGTECAKTTPAPFVSRGPRRHGPTDSRPRADSDRSRRPFILLRS